MALSSTLFTAQLQVADQDRHHYHNYSLKLALHPSETEERLVARLLVWCLFADENLKFAKGLSSSDEPDIWQHHDHGDIAHWIEVGEPEANRLKKASRMADKVTVLAYTRSQQTWWQKQGSAIRALPHTQVLSVESESLAPLIDGLNRHIKWQVTISEGALYITCDEQMIEVTVSSLTDP